MDIQQKIVELTATLKEAEATEKQAHEKAIQLRRTISKLNTVIRDAEDILEEKPLTTEEFVEKYNSPPKTFADNL